ncbi:MAG: type II toxin-antitoxin system VapC family toxin [Rhizobiaceae bacterium]|nr:type II toxin-antitoxin system VapC family toxin [Rhizobiaceae bacterium]
MSDYLLDTNTVIALFGNKSAAVMRQVERRRPGSIGICSVVAHELYFGAFKSSRVAHNLETIRLLFADLAILDFDREDARAAGLIRADLAAKGTPIGPYDVLIAGQARSRDAILVTNNLREFQRVDGLRVEDWTTSQ